MSDTYWNTLITMECEDCDFGEVVYVNNIIPCHVCFGTGIIEYEEVYDNLDDVIEDYPRAIFIKRYDDDERKEK